MVEEEDSVGDREDDDPPDYSRCEGQGNVRRWTGNSHIEHPLERVPEVVGIDRNRLRPPEQERRAHDQKEDRHKDRPDRIDVRKRVQGEPSARLRRRITEAEGHVTMRHLVQDDGGKDRDERQDDLQNSCDVHFPSSSARRSTVSVSSLLRMTSPGGEPFGLRT